jgi:cell division protease FtsH
MYVLIALLIFTVLQSWLATNVKNVSYSKFMRMISDGKISAVVVSQKYLKGYQKVPEAQKEPLFPKLVYETPRLEDPNLVHFLEQNNTEIIAENENTFLMTLLSWVAPALIFVGIWLWAMKKMGQGTGFMTLGKNKAKIVAQTDVGVTFNDVAGEDEAKQELQEILEFLKNPTKFTLLGAKIPKGVLLVGPPGTGKTLLAKAVAGEAGVPFFSISGSEFVEMFVGVGAARVRDLFEQARARAPAIIFIDELDALGRARGAYGGLGGLDEKEQTLNQLLAEMDGFDTSVGLIILAATNRPEILDPALLRAGRFDRQVLVDRPDRKGRIDILKVHVRKIPLDPAVSLDQVAALTPGFSGADLANLVNEAALAATRRQATAVTMNDFTSAVERIVAGLERRSRLLGEKERRLVAYHEMGHALVALSQRGGDAVHKISIIPRGIGALGYTIQRPSEDRYLATRGELQRRIAVLLGGRAAEMLVFDEASTGAADDLAKATDIARDMVMRHGMDPGVGPVSIEPPTAALLDVAAALGPPRATVSEAMQQRIDNAIHDIVTSGLEQARGILQQHRDLLERGALELLQKETLDEDAIRGYEQAMRES